MGRPLAAVIQMGTRAPVQHVTVTRSSKALSDPCEKTRTSSDCKSNKSLAHSMLHQALHCLPALTIALTIAPQTAKAYLDTPPLLDPLVDPLVDAHLGPLSDQTSTSLSVLLPSEIAFGFMTLTSVPIFGLLTLRFAMSWYPAIERKRKEHPWSTWVTFPTDPLLAPARKIFDKFDSSKEMSTVDRRDPAMGGVDISPVAVGALFCGLQELAVVYANYSPELMTSQDALFMIDVMDEIIQLEGEMLVMAWTMILLRWGAFI
eukprot:CAMPEP_0197853466 /NCGR_PEP_ID=MMETSP1438-20131217/22780_1 /TAXON_ID=1461541 /ORGANISM="Pterosperma sp., Strain CCMP1384" /LENGTH=260 /DNA_ID=CAMNT_0043467887 /DNA_START=691 /DNA_END=1473 /DNA_ORIENTATION=-